MQFPLDTVREVAQILQKQGLGEITLESGGARLTLKRPPYAAPLAFSAPGETLLPLGYEAAAGAPLEEVVTPTILVASPAVGVFREAKKPLQVGDEVARKAILGAVETLNIPTELTAPQNARVIQILAIEGQRVEWGQPLLELEAVESTSS